MQSASPWILPTPETPKPSGMSHRDAGPIKVDRLGRPLNYGNYVNGRLRGKAQQGKGKGKARSSKGSSGGSYRQAAAAGSTHRSSQGGRNSSSRGSNAPSALSMQDKYQPFLYPVARSIRKVPLEFSSVTEWAELIAHNLLVSPMLCEHSGVVCKQCCVGSAV